MPPRDLSSAAAINQIITFNPPIRNVTYTGVYVFAMARENVAAFAKDNPYTSYYYPPLVSRWATFFNLLITFGDALVPNYPNLLDYSIAIGGIAVSINPAGNVLSRDGSSPPVLTERLVADVRMSLRACSVPHKTLCTRSQQKNVCT